MEEKHLPTGVILEDEGEAEEEKNTSFDHKVTRGAPTDVDKNQHGYLVREIMDNNEKQAESKPEQKEQPEPKTKIRMGRIGTKKKETSQSNTSNANQSNPHQEATINVKVESIEDVEALRKAVQNLCQ